MSFQKRQGAWTDVLADNDFDNACILLRTGLRTSQSGETLCEEGLFAIIFREGSAGAASVRNAISVAMSSRAVCELPKSSEFVVHSA